MYFLISCSTTLLQLLYIDLVLYDIRLWCATSVLLLFIIIYLKSVFSVFQPSDQELYMGLPEMVIIILFLNCYTYVSLVHV